MPELKPYPVYKNSGLPWLGEVPLHWSLLPNRSLMRQRKVLVGKRNTEYRLLSLTKQGVIVRDVKSGKGKSSVDMETFKEVRKGDLIFCLFDIPETPRTVGLSHHNGMITGAYTIMECSNPVLSAFLNLFYQAIDDRKLLSPIYSGLRNTIPPTRFLGIKTALPPPAEQAAIVRFVDHIDRRIRRYIRAKQKLIKLLEEQKQVIIHRAVTRALDPSVHLKPSGVEWVGNVPEHWEVRRLKTLCGMRSGEGITAMSIEPAGDYPVYGGNGIRGYTSQYTHDGEFALIGRQGALCGNVHISRGRFWASEHAVVASLHSGHVLDWFGALLVVMNLNQYSIAAAQPGLAVERILNLWVPVPPAQEQARIAKHIEHETADIVQGLDHATREISLLREYRTRLFADVVTGKLDVREAAAPLPDEVEEPEPLEAADASGEGSEENENAALGAATEEATDE